MGSIGTKDHEKMLGIVAVGIYSQGVPKIHGTHDRAHRAVIFATAQLSC